jgi:hypothetical protein
MDTVRYTPGFGRLFTFQTLITGLASHYHLRLKFSNTTSPAWDTSRKLWVLLTRHVANTKENSDYIALRVESEFDRRISQQRIDQIAEAVSRIGLIHARVNSSGAGSTLSGLIHKFDPCVGKSTALRQMFLCSILACLQARVSAEEIREGSLSLVASYDGEVEEVGFTITAFSTISSLSWDETPTKLPFSHKVRVTLSPPLILPSGQVLL